MSDILQNIEKYGKRIFLYVKNDKIFSIPLKYVIGVFFLFMLTVLIGFHSITPADDQEQIVINVKPGMRTSQIAELLKDKNIIYHDVYFKILAQLKGLDKGMKVGEYVLHRGMSSSAVMDELIKGPQTVIIRVTVPEGYTVEQIADLLERKKITSKQDFLTLAKKYIPYEYMQNSDPNVKYKLEGYLFPDTYEFIEDTPAKKVIDAMTGEFDKKIDASLRERAKQMNLSMHELVVMASLVEAEAKFNEDRPLIAQVFFNRLKINMPLQSDTTIQYAMIERKENVSIKDTKIDSPYNTYIHYGLPPGAVDNPGIASVRAVLYPQMNDYLYFVADSEGHNHYSRTYQEHLINVNNIE
ncbi:endolytic transglycosylase MltG [Pectinatus haikarae]|uniref:endolytic transglycosylase MltG n=1 Tax=Pectinatus haikarae TaxID=349096 RepID=UPI0018C4FE76|nr:endolytic transglycosylase MltG [Pectinatus haikarae]